MKIFHLRFFIIFFLLPLLSYSVIARQYQNKSQDTLQSELVKDISLLNTTLTSDFISSFMDAYKNVSVETLKVADKKQFLQKAFQEEIDDFQKPGVFQVALKNDKNVIIGFFSIDDIDHRKKVDPNIAQDYKNFPEKAAYIRQLYILPEFQKKGNAQLMINQILYEFLPNVKHIYVAARRVNEKARKLYESCGFKESHEVLHGLSPERYMSFEKHIDK